MSRNFLYTLAFLFWSLTFKAKSEVTFGTLPTGCTLKSVGDVMDMEEKIDCEGANYQEIPFENIPCNTRRINFANNNFSRITRDSFRGLQQLEEIVLSGNRIRYIEAEAFAGLPNLRTLNLVDNQLTEIDERPFWRGKYDNLFVSVDGNPWYCDEDLKETVDAISKKVSFIGLRCRGGFIRGLRGTIVGREYEDIRDRIENDFESWEIALIVSGSFAAAFLAALVAYGVFAYRQYNSYSDEYEMQGTKEETRFLDRGSNISGSGNGSPVSGTAVDPTFKDRKIHIKSENHFNRDDESLEGARRSPAESPESGPSRPEPPRMRGIGRVASPQGFRADPEMRSPSLQSPPPRPPPIKADMQRNMDDEIHV